MQSKNKETLTSYERARKRVDDIKGFYGHLAVYIFVNGSLLLTRSNFNFYLEGNSAFADTDFLNRFNWETYGTPLFWSFGLVFHAICIFGKNPFLGKVWEERQIQKYLDSHEESLENYK